MYDVAPVCVRRALLSSVGFDVELLIDIETIISRVEIIGQKGVSMLLPTASALSAVPAAARKANICGNDRDKKRKKT